MKNKKFFSLENLYKFLNNKWGQFFLIAMLVFIIFSPVLLGNKIFLQGDSLTWSYPDIFFYQESIQNNTSFLWNPYILSGFPIFLSDVNLLSPLFYFFIKFFYFLTVYHWLIFLVLVLAGYLTTRLLVHFNVSAIPALIGGICYILGSISLITDLVVISYLPFIPAIIWLLIICYEKNTWKPVFLGILLVCLVFVSVHYNWQLIIFFTGLVFSLFYPWVKKELNYKKYLILFVKYSLMILGGFLLALPLLSPLINYLPYSHRGGGLSYSEATSGSAQILDFIHFIFPYFNPPFFASGTQFYLGVLPLFFLLFSFILFKRDRIVKFFSLIFVFCILISVKYSPIFWLMQKMPFINSLRGPSRVMALGLFAGAILAGVGAENFFKLDFEKFRIKLTKIFKWTVLLIILFSLFFNIINYFLGNQILNQAKIYFNQNFYQQTTGLPLEHYYSVIDQIYFDFTQLVSFANLKFLFPLLAVIISYLIIELFVRKKQWQNYFYISILLAVIANFFLVLPFSYQLVSRRIFNYQPKIAQHILIDPGKIFTFLPGFSEFDRLNTPYNPNFEQIFIFQSELLVPNIGTFYNIKSADGYNSLMPKKYAEVLALIGSDRAVAGDKLSELKIPLAEKIELFKDRLNLIDMLGVKYVVSAYQIEDEHLENVFETEATDYKIPLYLYQNKNNVSEVYFAKSVGFLMLKQDDKNLQIIIKKENNFNEKTFIECFDCQEIKEPVNSLIEIIEEKNNYSQIKTSNQNDGWLIFNQSNLPGWQASVDGSIVPIYNANYLFQGIFIPAGEHEVIFKYSPLPKKII